MEIKARDFISMIVNKVIIRIKAFNGDDYNNLHKLLDSLKFAWTARDHDLLGNLNVITTLHKGSDLLSNSWLINNKPQFKINYVLDLFETLMIKFIDRVSNESAEELEMAK
jgi:hypothetical protein